jgi:transposase
MAKRTKEIRMAVARLDSMIKEYKEEKAAKKRDWKTYEEQFYQRLKFCFAELAPLIDEAILSIKITEFENRGAASKLTLKQKVYLLLVKHFCAKSNRCMAGMVFLFSHLTSIDISYKTVERLYSDHLVQCAIFNLHVLLLKKKGIECADCCGDGTGYAIAIKQHYATHAQKLKDKGKENGNEKDKKYIFSFAIMDIKSRLYIGFGTSLKSEKEAFLEALKMVKSTGIIVDTLRLDRYFSCEAYVECCKEYLGKVKLFLVPKSNIATIGLGEWSNNLYRFVEDTKGFLKEYFQRNQSESGISEDKKRVGWKILQKIEARIDTANSLTMLWHNLFWVGADV